MKHVVKLTRSRVEVATIMVEADDKASARMKVEAEIADADLPMRWKPRSTGRPMIESIKREGE